MRLPCLLFVLVPVTAMTLLTAAGKAPPSADQRLATMLSDDWALGLRESPESATWLGYPGYNDHFSDLSIAAMNRRYGEVKTQLEHLRTLPRADLSPANQLNYDLAVRQAEETLEGQKFGGEYLPITQLGGVQQMLPQLLSIQPAKNAADYRDILARLKAVPVLIDQTIDLMAEGLRRGLTPPRITLRDVPEQIKAQIVDEPLQSAILQSFKAMPKTIEAKTRDRLTAEAIATYQTAVAPALQKLYTYFNDTYLTADPHHQQLGGPAQRERVVRLQRARRDHYQTKAGCHPCPRLKRGLNACTARWRPSLSRSVRRRFCGLWRVSPHRSAVLLCRPGEPSCSLP